MHHGYVLLMSGAYCCLSELWPKSKLIQTTTVQKQKQVKNINGRNLNAIVITLVCALENKQDMLDQAITNIFIYI